MISKKIKIFDLTIVFLVSSIVLFSSIFTYINSSQSKRMQYEKHNEKLYELQILNIQFDNFVLNGLAVKNYDVIVAKIKEFEKICLQIENSLVYQNHRIDLNSKLKSIKEDFAKKRVIIERYKAYRATILYSFPYVRDLIKNLKKENTDEGFHEKMNQIFFGLVQLYLNYDKEDFMILKDIESFSQDLIKKDNTSIFFFSLHVKTLYEMITKMNVEQKKYIINPLQKDIIIYQDILLEKFEDLNYFYQKMYRFLFLFSLLLLVALLLSYIKSLKLKKDLVSFKYAVENSDDSVVITDTQRHITYVNDAFTKITGYSKDEALGQNPSILKSGHMSEDFYKQMNEILDRGEKWSGEFINKNKYDEIYYEKASITPMFINDKLNGYLAIKLNVTDYVKQKKEVEFLAYHDSLTMLPNRRMMKEVVTKEIEKVKTYGSYLDLLFLDLDGFKSINDTLGHNIGDYYLQETANKLRKFLKKENTIFRTGGDEFAILLSYKDGACQSEAIASQIIKLINEPIYTKGNELTAGVSIGISSFNILSDDVMSLLKHSDIAMYEAKKSGKNRFCNYTKELSQKIEKKMRTKQLLKNAFQRDEFYVVYQPKYSLDTREIRGLEVLIRWNNPELGLVPPDYFIPIAEEMQVINDIGIFVFEQACSDFVEFKKYMDSLASISVNLSPLQLMNPTLLEDFKKIVKNTDIEPSCMGLEITETHIMKNIEKSSIILRDMQDFGFKIVIDDFGTGYSSMSYLKKLPIDSLKIDKSFIDDICVDENDIKIVKAIISIANSFDYKIVAEGIETKAQEEILKSLGVSTGQGYYFSKPKRKEELF